MAQTDAAFKGAVAIGAFGAVWLRFALTLAVTLKSDGDCEGVLEAHRLDDKSFLLLFRAAMSTCLHTE